jgi:hypothetical protein
MVTNLELKIGLAKKSQARFFKNKKLYGITVPSFIMASFLMTTIPSFIE